MSEETLISEEQIKERIQTMAKEIASSYQGKDVFLLGVLSGGFMFLSDLARAIWREGVDANIAFVTISSYGSERTSSGDPVIDHLPSLLNQHVLIVEDIVDTGYSMQTLLAALKKQTSSIKIAALLSKPSKRKVDVVIDFLGFEIPDVWVEGYGLDSDGKGRGRPDIITRK